MAPHSVNNAVESVGDVFANFLDRIADQLNRLQQMAEVYKAFFIGHG
jgi:hypothetical protein